MAQQAVANTSSRAAAGRLDRALALAGSCHPGPVVAVTAMAGAYARSVGRSRSGVLAVSAAVLAGQLSIGWQNDALDLDRDRRAARSDKPAAAGRVGRATIARAAVVAGAACVPLSLASGRRAGAVHLSAVTAAYAYNVALKATPLSVAPYVVAFGALPFFVTLGGKDPRLPPWWAPVATGLLGAAAHAANVLPDLEADAGEGILGLPHRLGRAKTTAFMALSATSASAVVALGGPGRPRARLGAFAGASLLCTAALAIASRDRASRQPFRLIVASALVDVAALLGESRRATLQHPRRA